MKNVWQPKNRPPHRPENTGAINVGENDIIFRNKNDDENGIEIIRKKSEEKASKAA